MTSIQLWLSDADAFAPESALQRAVWEELRREPGLDLAAIAVDVATFGATLRGTVASYWAKVAAARAAKRVPGLERVMNELVVTLPPESERADEDLADTVTRAFASDVRVPAEAIRAQVRNGWVLLEGHLARDDQRSAAEQAVEQLTGIRGVTNLIDVVPPAVSERDLRSRVADSLAHDPPLRGTHIKVTARSGRVVLQGDVRSLAERDEAEHVARAAGASAVEDELKIRR